VPPGGVERPDPVDRVFGEVAVALLALAELAGRPLAQEDAVDAIGEAPAEEPDELVVEFVEGVCRAATATWAMQRSERMMGSSSISAMPLPARKSGGGIASGGPARLIRRGRCRRQ
jgi:hypothetical protein